MARSIWNLTPVCGYDGPSGSIFLLNVTGEATTEDGWRIFIGSSVPTLSLIAYVHDPQGKQIGTYSISAASFAEEALKLAKAKKAERESNAAATTTGTLPSREMK